MNASKLMITVSLSALGLVLLCFIGAGLWLRAAGFTSATPMLLLAAAAVFAVAYIFLFAVPLVLPEEPLDTTIPVREEKSAASQVLLVSGGGEGAAAWLDTLRNTIGPVATVSIEQLKGKPVTPFAEDKSFVVVPSEEAAALLESPGFAESLRAAAASGAAVIVDCPPAGGAEALGLIGKREQHSGVISYITSEIMPEQQCEFLESCPVPISVAGPETLPMDFAALMKVDDFPAVAAKALGSGAIIITLFNFADTLSGIRGGSKHTGIMTSLSGTKPYQWAAPHLRDSVTPFADLLDAFIISAAGHFAPQPSWWPHPAGAPASLIATCNDDSSGRRTAFMLDMLKDAGAIPTVFAVADGGPGAKIPADAAGSTGLLWNRFSLHFSRGALRTRKHTTLESQMKALNTDFPAASGTGIVRILSSRWDGSFSSILTLMNRAGVMAEASFGPPPGRQGYSFGTGFPFTLGGGDNSVLELPYHIHDSGGPPAPKWMEKFVDSMTLHNSAAAFAFHPLKFIQSKITRDSALKLVSLAKEKGFHLTDAAGFLAFQQARASSPIASKLTDAGLEIEAEAAAPDMCLKIPQKIKGRAVATVLIDGNPAGGNALESGILPLPQGKHSISINTTL